MSITFDTLQYANELKKAGVQAEQAEAQAEALMHVFSGVIEDKLATKEDIYRLENKLTLRVGVMLAGSITILSTLLIILHIH